MTFIDPNYGTVPTQITGSIIIDPLSGLQGPSGSQGPAGPPGSGGGDSAASYLVLGLTSSLSAERVLTAGTNITFSDTGPKGTLTINATGGGGYPPDYASLTGSTFTGPVLATAGLSGSLQKTTAGLSYLTGRGRHANSVTVKRSDLRV